jgi:hypothetical protein
MSTSVGACATCSWSASRLLAGARSWSATGAPASTGRTPIKELVDVHYPDAEQIVLIQDNLNTHTPASLYAAFPPAEARRLANKLELHSTPKHGSWLNMAEIELAMLAGQCLDRRLADLATLEREVTAWQAARNRAGRGVTGGSRPRMPASSSSTSTPQLTTDEPLGTARLRWRMDQTWTGHARSRGQRRSASRTLPGKETPAGCPRQASPAGRSPC